MIASKITLENGEIMLGRIVSSEEKRIRLMIVGNRIVDIPKDDIKKEEYSRSSLMYEDLLHGMSGEEVDALLSYVISLKDANEK
jgi:hypothetical protein